MTITSKDPRLIQKRVFACAQCGTRQPATKRSGKTAVGHAKLMWCCVCADRTEHTQID